MSLFTAYGTSNQKFNEDDTTFLQKMLQHYSSLTLVFPPFYKDKSWEKIGGIYTGIAERAW